jgi:carbonic anhydrase/acetyltransferase-like protein (isoleucine patch superfamily)
MIKDIAPRMRSHRLVDRHRQEGPLLHCNRLVLDEIVPRIDGDLDEDSRVEGRVVIEAVARLERSVVRGPAIIGAGAILVDTYVGPYTSIGDRCELRDAEIEHSVLLEASRIIGVHHIHDSLLGREVEVVRSGERPKATRLMLGDHRRPGAVDDDRRNRARQAPACDDRALPRDVPAPGPTRDGPAKSWRGPRVRSSGCATTAPADYWYVAPGRGVVLHDLHRGPTEKRPSLRPRPPPARRSSRPASRTGSPPRSIMTYLVDGYYNPADGRKSRDDPGLALDWGVRPGAVTPRCGEPQPSSFAHMNLSSPAAEFIRSGSHVARTIRRSDRRLDAHLPARETSHLTREFVQATHHRDRGKKR